MRGGGRRKAGTVETLAALFVVGTVLAGGWVAWRAQDAAEIGPVTASAYVVDYDGRLLDDGLEILIAQGDGQAFATLARDPLLRRPEAFRRPAQASYRAQRPLLGWLATAGSFGRSGWVPPALAVISCTGAGAAAAGIGELLRRRGRSPWIGLSVLLLPGTAVALSSFGPEPLVLALLAWGLVFWEREEIAFAVVCFCLAALGRETALLVPLALGTIALSRRRWRPGAALVAVPAVMLAWYVVLRLHLGAWPWDAGRGRIGAPFVGLAGAAREGWLAVSDDALYLALPILVVLATVVIARRDHLSVIVVVHAVFGTMLGELVWSDTDHYSRVLLPLYAFGIVAIVGSSTVGTTRAANPGVDV